jgi:sulfur carrier protein ThiS adenylyltransferase
MYFFMLKINEQEEQFCQGSKISDFLARYKADADLFIVDGYPVSRDYLLSEGDQCWLIKKGEPVNALDMEKYLYARHTPGVQDKIKNSIVGIMGLGGLGSIVAGALARIGIGKLILADYDSVEPTNLNRQQYFFDQVGMLKTKALQENLNRMNPGVQIQLINKCLSENSIKKCFSSVDVLVECFDDPAMKAAALRVALTEFESIKYITSSGMAGYGDNNLIQTRKIYPGVYMVGDEKSAAGPGCGLMATRVGIAAHHQANQVLRILMGEE